MVNTILNLKKGWWSFALPGYRDHSTITTYSLFSYEDLPPISVPGNANWQWLEAQHPHKKWSLASNGYPDGSRADLSNLHDLIAQAPFEIPEQFIKFIEIPSLHGRIRSCTACLLELSDFLVHTSTPPNGLIIQFLVDQQGCLRWYLFADALGNHCVLVSGETFGLFYDPNEVPRNEVDLFREEIWLCAPSFSEFIYRFWLENEIYFTLVQDPQAVTSLQRDYLSHYR